MSERMGAQRGRETRSGPAASDDTSGTDEGVEARGRVAGHLVSAQMVPALFERTSFASIETVTGPCPAPSGDDLYWVSPDMTDLAFEAARELRELRWSTVQVPSRTGIVFFAQPIETVLLVGPLGTEEQMPVAVRAIYWHQVEDEMRVVSYVHGDQRPGGGLEMLGSSVGKVDDLNTLVGVQPPQVLATLFLLMEQPGVAAQSLERSPSAPPRRVGGRTVRGRRPPPVRVVTIRPGSDNARLYDQAEGRDVAWRHRWMVKGHWRNQPYRSLGEGVTKPIWIAPYLKGPEGAPVLRTPKVHAVRPRQ